MSRLGSTESSIPDRLEALSSALDLLPVVAYLSDTDGNITFVSTGWQRYTGNDARDLMGRGYLALVHPDDLDVALAAYERSRAAGSIFSQEVRLRFGDGSYRWVSTRADPIRDEAGEIRAWCGLIREVHEWRLAEQAMREALRAADERADSLARSEERYRLLGESLPGTTWTATPDGKLDHVTGGNLRVALRPVETRLGDGWLDGLHPDDRERARARWRASVESGEPYDIQFRVRMAGGEHRWHLVRALPQRDESGAIVRWVGVNVDIDDQRRADEAREKFVALVENSGDIIAMTDGEGRLTYANPAARELLGIDASRLTHIIECFRPEDRAFVESVIVPAIEREGRYVSEFQMQNVRTGAAVPILHSAFALTGANGEKLGMATISRDRRDRQRIDIGMRALAEAGAVMYNSLDYEQTLRNIAEAVARTYATFCSIDVVDGDGAFRRVAVAHSDPELRRFLLRYADQGRFSDSHPVSRAILLGASTCVTDAASGWADSFTPSLQSAFDTLRVRSFVTVPVRAPDGTILGALSCSLDLDDLDRPSYTPDDLPFAEELGRRAGIAVQHARAYEREHAIAMRFQEASLPGNLPQTPGVVLSADYRPGNTEATIGGDWYDAFALEDGRLVITIGDVLGKGLDAAVTMAKVRQAMRSAAALLPDPLAMLTAADSAVRDVAPDTYATALAAVYDPRSRQLTFATAGHAGPTIVTADGTIEDRGARGIMLGLRPTDGGESVTLAASPGSAFVFFTDGLTEATRDLDEGYRRLHAALGTPYVVAAKNPARELVDHVLDGRAAADDVAVLVAQIAPLPVRGTWRVPARVDEVAIVRKAVRTLLREAAIDDDDRSRLELAAGELASNAVKYGRGGFVEVSLEILGERAALGVVNSGDIFEPPSVDLRSIGLGESGRGLALLCELGFTLSIARAAECCAVTATLDLR